MSGTLVAAVIGLVLAGPQSPQGQGAVEQELIALDKKFDEARRKGDTAFVSDLLTEDFVRITGAAAVQTKADIMKAMAADGRWWNTPATTCPGRTAADLHRATAW